MPLNPGDRIERFVVVDRLGAGGMGEVYRAHDPALKRDVALKILRADPGATVSRATERMLSEARKQARLDHPNIAAVYDAGQVVEPAEHRGAAFLAMELIVGAPLRRFIGDAAVDTATRVRWLEEIARALGAAHAQGLVHRDVKPENVMIRADDRRAKVVDFGIAKRTVAPIVDLGAATITQEREGVLVGTPMYMAPEQIAGEELDGRADQFAWGVVAYELLTGRELWSLEHGPGGLWAQILDGPRPGVDAFPGVDERVARTVIRALAVDKAQRFATMEELADALTRGSTAPIGATLAAALEARPRRASRRLRWIALAGGLALVAASILLARRARPPAPAPSGSTPVASRAPPAPEIPAFAVTYDASPNAEASRFYAAGMQALRDASYQSATSNLRRAIEKDPSCARAHVAMALSAFDIDDDARDHFGKAMLARASLSERDRALLEALRPAFEARPDAAAARARLRDALARAPGDGDVRYQVARMDWLLGDLRDAVTTLEDVTRRDPNFARAWRDLAWDAEFQGDADRARDGFQRCVAIAPSATECWIELGDLELREGRCREMEAAVRRAIAGAPDSSRPYERLAEALFGQGTPVEAVRDAVDAALARVPEARRAPERAHWRYQLAVIRGDFDDALRATGEWRKATSGASSFAARYFPVDAEVKVLVETGRDAEARRELQAFDRAASALSEDSYFGDLGLDASATLYRLGALARPDFVAEREAWLARNAAPGATGWEAAAMVWPYAFVTPARTADDAREALGARDRYAPIAPAAVREPTVDGEVGRVLLLAGRGAEALPYLRRAAASCGGLVDPVPYVQSVLALAAAAEGAGDAPLACSALSRVLAWWGSSRTSVSARDARARQARLGCR